MDRRQELDDLFKESDASVKQVIYPMIDEIIYLENILRNLRKLPFIQVKEGHPERQKATPASKQYKELLQQYNNCIKILLGAVKNSDFEEGTSPLREYFKNLNKEK